MKNIIYLCAIVLLFSCEKEQVISDTPIIEFKSISPATVQEYSDDIIITISYSDGDGDLGENNPDIHNLFVEDNRNGIVYQFRIPHLAPDNNSIAIEGDFNITINGSGITDESSSQQVNYAIYVTDRAGNKSNTIITSSITIQQ
tara:strand:+ start:424 stop:855 length:432 start_codon:yes stop_codon:yes gene_type:complete